MKTRLGSCLLLTALLSTLALLLACGDADPPASVPVALPTESPPESARPLSAADLETVNSFVNEQQTVSQEWDRFHQELDRWRAGLTACHGSAMREALRDFAVGFNAVTGQARDLPRSPVTLEFADTLIAAAEAEETAFRLLRDRWQPNSLSLFEEVERQRAGAAAAQNRALDRATALRAELERAADPRERRALEDFSAAFDLAADDWEQFHDDYADLLREADGLDAAAFLARLGRLIQQFGAISTAISRLPPADAGEEAAETLEDRADDELRTLTSLHDALALAIEQAASAAAESEAGEQDDGEGQDKSQQQDDARPADEPDLELGPFLVAINAAIVDTETTLRQASRDIHAALDRTSADDLDDVRAFIGGHGELLARWDAFHARYDEWRRTEGGCDRSEVLQSLGRFNTRIVELGRQVRDLPQSSHLLPIYNLLVQAVEREEGAMRALRNTWQPFTVDAFIAVDRERDNANRLRREANIALQELRARP